MHNVLAFRYPVRVLKCVPLHPIQNRSRYAYWKVRFCTENPVSPSEAFQTNPHQVRRQDQRMVVFSLEPYAGSDVRPADGLRNSQGAYRYYNRPWKEV